MWILWKMIFWNREFWEKWDFQNVIFWINWGFLPQCIILSYYRGVSWCDNDTFISSQNQLSFAANVSTQRTLCHRGLALPLFTSWIHPRPSHNGHDHIINFSRHVRSCKVTWHYKIQLSFFSPLFIIFLSVVLLSVVFWLYLKPRFLLCVSTLFPFSISVRKWHFSITLHTYLGISAAQSSAVD